MILLSPMPYNQIRFNKQMIAINRFCTSYIESATIGDKQSVLVPIQVLWQIRDLANHARQFHTCGGLTMIPVMPDVWDFYEDKLGITLPFPFYRIYFCKWRKK